MDAALNHDFKPNILFLIHQIHSDMFNAIGSQGSLLSSAGLSLQFVAFDLTSGNVGKSHTCFV